MKKEIIELQKLMHKNGIDVFYVPSSDPHGSEYMNDHYKVSEFLSGLHSENEELVVTEDAAYIWTDGRFFLQAETELEGSGIQLMKMKEPGVPTVIEFMKELISKHGKTHVTDDFRIGFDGSTLPAKTGLEFEKEFSGLLGTDADQEHERVRLTADADLGGLVWDSMGNSGVAEPRPEIIPSDIWELPVSSAGLTAEQKIEMVRSEMEKKGADWLLLTDLMETAWLLNLRGDDILYTPVFFSYVLMSQDTVRLYVMRGAVDKLIQNTLDVTGGKSSLPGGLESIEICDYDDVFSDVAALPLNAKVWLDTSSANYSLYINLPDHNNIIDEATPVSLMKTVKNDIEIACTRNAHIKDGAAVTEFISWIKDLAAQAFRDGSEFAMDPRHGNFVKEAGVKYLKDPQTGGILNEVSASDYLEACRREKEGCFDISFHTIAGYGPNGAIIHYSPLEETAAELRPEGFFLVDSGGQYIDGTTDITRTIAVGPLSQEMIDNYTRVLQGHIALSRYVITPDTTMKQLDQVSRDALQDAGLDFNHGVAHGVGHVLSVHEGPAGIRRTDKDEPHGLRAGMIISNEPGYYKAGEYGIRIENEILIKYADDLTDMPEGTLISEPITCVPYEREAINTSMLSDDEIAWINDYHRWVRDSLLPLVDEKTAEYLIGATKPIY